MNRYVIDRAALDGNVRQVVALAGRAGHGRGEGERLRFRPDGDGVGMQARRHHALRHHRVGRRRAPARRAGRGDDVLVMRSTALADEAAAIVRSGCIATVGSRAAAVLWTRRPPPQARWRVAT